jgi:uncharacterized RDD family membrane protein YckC
VDEVSAPPNWYPTPDGRGGQRYWDGSAWTEHWVPPPPPPRYGSFGGNFGSNFGALPWKGAQLGRPAQGSGALANPGRRLAARVLDSLLLLVLFAVLLTVTLLIAAPHFGPIFPSVYVNNNAAASEPTPGFVWIYLTIFGCGGATGIAMLVYETVGTARYGRTLGKAWLRIRPVRVDGSPLGWGRALGRVSIYWAFGFVSPLGLIDPLFCLWDDKQQCLHDKVVDSIVINDDTGSAQPEQRLNLVVASQGSLGFVFAPDHGDREASQRGRASWDRALAGVLRRVFRDISTTG